MTELVPILLLVSFALLMRTRTSASPRAISAATLGFGAALTVLLWIVTGGVSLTLAELALLLSIAGPLRPRPPLPDPAWLEGIAPVVLCGLASGLAIAYVWGLRPAAPIPDEAAYLLQARIFAAGHWIAPSPPLPEFFEQLHVFVTPFLASKYPPGHSLLMVPGIWLGVPALVPILLNAVTGALVFAHARRLAGGSVALATFLLWLSAPGTFWYRASYLSENTTCALWLLALWVLRDWLEKGGHARVALLALCLGWGAITRPMTMFALALPIAFVFLRRVVIRRTWGDLATAVAAGGACLLILPVWAAQTTGDWRVSPYRQYSRVYFPYEWAGFGVRPDPPLRPIPESLAAFGVHYRRLHTEHTVSALPDTALRRLHAIGQDEWGDRREGVRPFGVLGVLAFDAQAAFGLVSALLLFIGYLFFAHSPAWNPYYLEVHPVLSFATALGLCGALASVLSALPMRNPSGPSTLRRLSAGFACVAVMLAVTTATGLLEARDRRRFELSPRSRFETRIASLPGPAIVFVHYDPDHGEKGGLVQNAPDLAAARVWVAHDLGERDRELARLAPERRPYLYDDRRQTLRPLSLP